MHTSSEGICVAGIDRVARRHLRFDKLYATPVEPKLVTYEM